MNTTAPPAGPKNYVFVDEHNRHKRLKVMRACEGCRRRKIRCDAATTNSWPCAACTRLKLHCVPPVGGNEGEHAFQGSFTDSDELVDYQDSTQFQTGVMQHVIHDQQSYMQPYPAAAGPSVPAYNTYGLVDQKASYLHPEQYNQAYPGVHQPPPLIDESYPQPQSIFAPTVTPVDEQQGLSSRVTPTDQYTAEDLSQHLGDLQIGENGIAPYIRQQKNNSKEPEAPIQEPEVKLPAVSTTAGSRIRVPPHLMPSDEEALQYFQVFFREVHPYAPIICRNYFYHQWHTNRASISPLLLEAIFACACRMSDELSHKGGWLEMANSKSQTFTA